MAPLFHGKNCTSRAKTSLHVCPTVAVFIQPKCWAPTEKKHNHQFTILEVTVWRRELMEWHSSLSHCGTRNPFLIKQLPLHPESRNIHELFVMLCILLEDRGRGRDTHSWPKKVRHARQHRDSWLSVFPFSSFYIAGVKVCAVGALEVFPSPLPQIKKQVSHWICEKPSLTPLLCLSLRAQIAWRSCHRIEPGLGWCLALSKKENLHLKLWTPTIKPSSDAGHCNSWWV